MTGEEITNQADKVANSVWLMLVARISMVVATVAGAPMAVWVVSTTNDTAKTLAIVQQDIRHHAETRTAVDLQLKLDIQQIRQEAADRLRDRYTAPDAARDFKLRDQRLDQHERRIDYLERPKN